MKSEPPRSSLPNVLYVGADKAGSSWVADALGWHPEVYVPPAKDLYFFDREYHRGIAWYERHFRAGEDRRVRAEICHDYLYSLEAHRRIRDLIPDVRLLVVLREPVDRSISSWLFARKHWPELDSFERAIAARPEILEHSRYGAYVRNLFAIFPRERIWVALFDDLKADPEGFALGLFRWLGIEELSLPRDLRSSRMQAAGARSAFLSRIVKATAGVVRGSGYPNIVGRVKRSPLVQRTLYRSLGRDERPAMSDELVRSLRDEFHADVEQVGRVTGLPLCRRWNYCPAADGVRS